MSDRLMSAEDLARVTGKKTSTKQAEWFREQLGVNVVRCGDGSPLMTWATFQALMDKRAGLSSGVTETSRPALRPAHVRSVR